MTPHLAGRGQERGEHGDNGDHEEPCDNESGESPAGELRLDQWLYDVRLVGLVSHYVSLPLFVASPISKFYRCCLELASGSNVDVVLLERPPLGEDWVHRRLWVGWIFKVAIRYALLRLETGQKLDELDSISAVLGVS